MPTYVFECPKHGRREVYRPFEQAGEPRWCEVISFGPGPTLALCNEPMRRIYSPSGIIMRPDGYSLRPGDKGYWNFNRQQELHQLRDGEAGDQRRLDASLFERPAPPKLELNERQMRDIRNLGEIVDREIRASDFPELLREGS